MVHSLTATPSSTWMLGSTSKQVSGQSWNPAHLRMQVPPRWHAGHHQGFQASLRKLSYTCVRKFRFPRVQLGTQDTRIQSIFASVSQLPRALGRLFVVSALLGAQGLRGEDVQVDVGLFAVSKVPGHCSRSL